MKPLSIYVHIPFCRHRCGYCDFNTYAGMNHFISGYMSAVQKEIDLFTAYSPVREDYFVHTIYFGGGTPSLWRGEWVTPMRREAPPGIAFSRIGRRSETKSDSISTHWF